MLARRLECAAGNIRVGNELGFSLNYGALLAAMTSEYVKKHPLDEGGPATGDKKLE